MQENQTSLSECLLMLNVRDVVSDGRSLANAISKSGATAAKQLEWSV
jgi:hypothetical protein